MDQVYIGFKYTPDPLPLVEKHTPKCGAPMQRSQELTCKWISPHWTNEVIYYDKIVVTLEWTDMQSAVAFTVFNIGGIYTCGIYIDGVKKEGCNTKFCLS